jgi:hypothetical protein
VTADRRLWSLLIQVSFCLSRALVMGSVKGKGFDQRVTIQARKTGSEEFRVDGGGQRAKEVGNVGKMNVKGLMLSSK